MSIIKKICGMPMEHKLAVFLWLVMLHSLTVGIGLITSPAWLLQRFGFAFDPARFFVTQGGVFHLVMTLCYGLAAHDQHRFEGLVILSIAAKSIATVFLLIYYLAVVPLPVVLLSALADFLMGLVIFLLHRSSRSGNR
ncbi:MAG: hypothetical protein ABIA75_12320 [Candidatus Neomarinimicrobiota bacterium]